MRYKLTTHNIREYGEIWKIIPKLSSDTHLNCFSGSELGICFPGTHLKQKDLSQFQGKRSLICRTMSFSQPDHYETILIILAIRFHPMISL